MGLIKFGIKVGLAYTAVYYLKEEGIWKESNVSLKIYDKLDQNLGPYVHEVKQQIPYQLPAIPKGNVVQLTKHYWNEGVLVSCKFISDLPEYTKQWSRQALSYLNNAITNTTVVESSKDTKK